MQESNQERIGKWIADVFKAIENKQVSSQPAELDMKKLRRMKRSEI